MMSPVRTAIKLGINQENPNETIQIDGGGRHSRPEHIAFCELSRASYLQSKTARDRTNCNLKFICSEKTGKEAIKLDKKAEMRKTQARLWDEHYGNNKPHAHDSRPRLRRSADASRRPNVTRRPLSPMRLKKLRPTRPARRRKKSSQKRVVGAADGPRLKKMDGAEA
jgi:hypothetical protein